MTSPAVGFEGRGEPCTARGHNLERTLLRVAIGPEAQVEAAWAARPRGFDLDEVRLPSQLRLLRAAGARLLALDAAGSDAPRLRGIARKQWVEHQLIARSALTLLDALADVGVEGYLHGGAALARAPWGWDGDLGTRWSDDTTVLVRPIDRHQAVAVVEGLGWGLPPGPRLHRRLEHFTSVPLAPDQVQPIQLAWAPSPVLPPEMAWWDHTDIVSVADRPVTVLSHALAVVELCGRSTRPSCHTDPEWLVDLDRLTRSTADGSAALARAVGWAALVTDRQATLDRHRQGTVPPGVPRDSARHRPWIVALDGLRAFLHRRSIPRRFLDGPQYLADRWFLDRATQIPAATAGRIRQRLPRGEPTKR